MRKVLPDKLEVGRVITGHYASTKKEGVYGAFFIMGPCGEQLKIISSGGDEPESGGWEHVSVSTRRRCPNWQEMSFVKDLYWEPEECVVQFHPPKSDHINIHPYCLHLWRHITHKFPMPPHILVGPK